MNISDISLRRPVLATVMSILIVVFGAISFRYLGVREYPAIDPPTISVRTSYTGANADVVESQITEPLEKAVNSIAGIRTVSSQSALGNSTITIEFDLNADLEQAANDVRDKVSQAVRNLPQDIDAPPVVAVSDASVLAAKVDGVLLVLKAGQTKRDYARQAKETLEKVNAHIVGAVLNNVAADAAMQRY